ncbi:Flagellin D [Anaerobiospirillum thomasii]|uniref:Flagellin n=1 Tax=Anaerobiospirillum thomasii TaxID=179995 RepID=A0A2X0VAJ5_9GAMM|nr:flagellin [Anaerobiospirillum thomasii]SPT69912.1 Flagellin D [Anaerobiospirillum thomasii]SPT71429.1 Flagellin D [Anaerobiospirillum thomasii]
MALYVNTNVSAINGQRKLTNSTNALNVSYQRLASGLRINSAKDDAAGLQISDRLTSQINGLGQGNRNCNDGIAFAQTIEGAMDEMTNMLQRVRTLSIQAANGTYSTEDRKSIQQEITQLSTEITRIACKTTYAGKTVLDGFRVNAAGGGNSNTTIIGSDGKVTFQVGANANDTIAVTDMSKGFMLSIIASRAGITAFNDTTGFVNSNGLVRFSVTNQSQAQLTLGNIDSMIQVIDSKRAELGAVQNRMESTIRNQANIQENESDARSRIRDTDFAEETAALTANQILQQASQSILSQANQRPQIALSLLGG